MSRAVRRVPADWVHPKDEDGDFKPLYPADRYQVHMDDFTKIAMSEGMHNAIESYGGQAIYRDDYMPDWPEDQKTHYMMYETTSEGTPISPAFSTPEKLARWLTDNNASAFGSMTADYDSWLRVIHRGWAPSAVLLSDGSLQSGVSCGTYNLKSRERGVH